MKKKTTSEKTAEKFAETIKNNPEEIIKWAESEIRCYKELIKLIQKNK